MPIFVTVIREFLQISQGLKYSLLNIFGVHFKELERKLWKWSWNLIFCKLQLSKIIRKGLRVIIQFVTSGSVMPTSSKLLLLFSVSVILPHGVTGLGTIFDELANQFEPFI
jgi:hypothetical protein